MHSAAAMVSSQKSRLAPRKAIVAAAHVFLFTNMNGHMVWLTLINMTGFLSADSFPSQPGHPIRDAVQALSVA